MTTHDRKDLPEAAAPSAGPLEEPRNREAELRKQRLAAALRENLKRRKAQARTRREPGEADAAGESVPAVASRPQVRGQDPV